MLVTDLAYRDMESRVDGLMGRIGGLLGRVFRRSTPDSSRTEPYQFATEHQAHLRLVSHVEAEFAPHRTEIVESGDFRWRRHPQLLNRSEAPAPVDTDDLERSARSASIRGLFLARSGRYDEARDAFATAALEASIDLTAIPGFWDLSRSGMLAAVGAYEDVERFRDAAALGARIRLMYRPRSVAALPDMRGRRHTASGS